MNFNSIIPKNYIERDIEKQVYKFLFDKEIIVIRGPRQSGKSTLLKKINQDLLLKYKKENILYIDFEDELEKSKFEENWREYLKFYLREKNRSFIILDEIQYLKDGGKILKLLFDHYPQIKFIVSGSSSLDINHLGEFLVGRAVFFELYPFSFLEYLKAKDKMIFQEYQEKKFSFKEPKKTESLFKDKLNLLLKEYLTFGGYPRVVLEGDIEKKKVLLKNLFSTYIEKDIIKIYGTKYQDKIINLLKYLSATIGNLINFNDIGQITGLHFQEIKELISILENTYVLKKINPFHKNLITEIKKNPKIYFFDSGFRNVLLERYDFFEEEWGQLAENYVFSVFKERSLNFWRTTAKAEVDFILKNEMIPIEVKLVPKITRSLLSFLESYQPKIALVVNWEKAEIKKIKNTQVFFVPLCLI